MLRRVARVLNAHVRVILESNKEASSSRVAEQPSRYRTKRPAEKDRITFHWQKIAESKRALSASDSRLLRLSRSCGCLTRCMNAPPPFAVPDFA